VFYQNLAKYPAYVAPTNHESYENNWTLNGQTQIT